MVVTKSSNTCRLLRYGRASGLSWFLGATESNSLRCFAADLTQSLVILLFHLPRESVHVPDLLVIPMLPPPNEDTPATRLGDAMPKW